MLLKELLNEIKQVGYISKPALAHKLGQPVSVIEDGLTQLVRMGYLQDGDEHCGMECGKCTYASFCNTTWVKTMKLTEKAEKLLTE